jgi:hypothetical protein
MAFECITEIPGGTQAQYDAVCHKIGLDTPEAAWPQGMISHCAGPMDNGAWCVVDEWESREDFQRFFETSLKSAMEEAGFGPAQPKWFPVHREFRSGTAQSFPLERAA